LHDLYVRSWQTWIPVRNYYGICKYSFQEMDGY